MNNELHKLRAIAERLRTSPEAVRKLFVQAGIYTEEGKLSEAFGGTMKKEKPMDQTNYSNTDNITSGTRGRSYNYSCAFKS